MRSISLTTSERVWRELEPLLALYERAPQPDLKSRIFRLSRAWAVAADQEAKVS